MTVERVLRTAAEVGRLFGALALERVRTGIVFNPAARGRRADPYPFYRDLRARDPIHRSWAAYGWVVSRHRDVIEILRDPRFSADDRHFSQYPRLRAQRIRDGLADPDREPAPVMLRIDPPDHTRLRSLVS